MSLSHLLLFLPACLAMNLIPGPNNLLSLHNGVHHGFRAACLAAIGRELAFAILIAASALGLAAVLLASATLFTLIKLTGALYLLYIAWHMWRGGELQQVVASSNANLRVLMQQEFTVAISNPKALLIFAAFLPQFVQTSQPVLPQLAILGSIFLLLEWLSIAAYALLGCRLQYWFQTASFRRVFSRSCASILALAGVGLMFNRAS